MNINPRFKLSNLNKLRPLSHIYRIQYGKQIKFKIKLIQIWIKNTIFFKQRKKTI